VPSGNVPVSVCPLPPAPAPAPEAPIAATMAALTTATQKSFSVADRPILDLLLREPNGNGLCYPVEPLLKPARPRRLAASLGQVDSHEGNFNFPPSCEAVEPDGGASIVGA